MGGNWVGHGQQCGDVVCAPRSKIIGCPSHHIYQNWHRKADEARLGSESTRIGPLAKADFARYMSGL